MKKLPMPAVITLLLVALLPRPVQATAPRSPMLDADCGEYPGIAEKEYSLPHGLTLYQYQDLDYVWFCYTLPDDSSGWLDLHLEAPGLSGPINLHASAQLGEWREGHDEEEPQSMDSSLWWQVKGWWASVGRFNGLEERDGKTYPHFQRANGREIQLGKERFGRGKWQLRFQINGIHTPTHPNVSIVYPRSDSESPAVLIVQAK